MSSRGSAFWDGPGGGKEVLGIAYPLILSQISYTLQTFIDRVFLTWWSAEAVGGAVTGAISTMTLVGLFLATGEYLPTFVAQYWGAGRHERIGTAVWQGIYFALAAGLGLALLSPLAGPFFALAGHPAVVREAETTYAEILMRGAAAPILM